MSIRREPSKPSANVADGPTNSLRRSVGPVGLVLALALCTLGVGNLVFPPELREQLPIDYLVICIPICGLAMLLNPTRLITNNVSPVLLLMFCVSILPGFFVSSLNPYGVSKALAFGIAVILLAAPSAFAATAYGARMNLRILLILGGVISVLLLVSGGEFALGRQSLFGLNPIGVARVSALFLALVAPLLFLRSKESRFARLLLFMAAPLALLATVDTGSRGPLLGAVVAVVATFLIVLAKRGVGPGTLAMVAGAGVSAFVALSFFADDGLDRITQGSDSGRFALYEVAYRTFLAHPIGVGWGNFAEYAPGYLPVNGYTLYPHNFFLELAVEGGILAVVGGLALIVVTIVALVRTCLRVDSPWPLVALAFVLFAVVNAQLSSDIVGNRMLWLALGLALVKFPQCETPGSAAFVPLVEPMPGVERRKGTRPRALSNPPRP